MEEFMENRPIVVPALKPEEKFDKGSFWDCRASKNIRNSKYIPKAPKGKGAIQYPIRTMDYNLKYIRNTETKIMELGLGLNLEAVILSIPVSVGSISYEAKHQTDMKKENLQIYYYREDYVKRLIPGGIASEIPAGATHIVTEVTYGAHFLADIVIHTKETLKMTNSKAAKLGLLVAGPLTALLESALSKTLGAEGSTSDVEITIESSHPDDMTPVSNVEEAFALIKKLDTLDPSPIKMLCIPVHQFFPDAASPTPQFKVIANHILEPLVTMIKVLTDYSVSKDKQEEPTYFCKRVMHADYRLRLMLEDVENDLGGKVIARSIELSELAKTLISEGQEIIDGIRQGKKDEEDIKEKLKEYQNDFNISKVESEISKYILKGKKQLSLINADDADEDVEAHFVTSDIAFKNKNINEDPVHVVLYTHSNSKSEIPRGVFLSIYELSKGMQVFVYMPNASNKKFQLNLHFGNIVKEYQKDEIMDILNSLRFAVGVLDGTAATFYQAVASTMSTPISLPIQKKKMAENLPLLLTELESWKDVTIFKTPLSFRTFLESNTTDLIYCIPTGPIISLSEGIQMIKKLRESFESLGKWVVADFGLNLDDGPVLVIFQDGKLITLIYDKLDLLWLIKVLNESNGQPRFDTIREKSNYFPRRIRYGQELQEICKFSLSRPTTITIHGDKLVYDTEDKRGILFDNAFQICKAYLSLQNREKNMINTLAKILTTEHPPMNPCFEQHGWSEMHKSFKPETDFFTKSEETFNQVVLPFRETISSQLYNSSPTLSAIGAFVYSIKFAAEAAETLIIENLEIPTARSDVFEIIKSMLSVSISHLEKYEIDNAQEVKEIIQNLSSATSEELKTSVEQCYKALKIIQEEIIVKKGEDTDAIIQLYKDLLRLLPTQIEKPLDDMDALLYGDQSWKKRNWKEADDDLLLEISKRHILSINWRDKQKDIEILLEKRLFFQIIRQIELLQIKESRFRDMLLSLEEVWDLTTGLISSLAKILKIIDEKVPNSPEEFEFLRFIWKNKIFSTFIYNGLDDPELYAAAKQHICDIVEDTGDRVIFKIPLWIPMTVRLKLQEMLDEDADNEDEDWIGGGDDILNPLKPENWSTIEDALKLLQNIVAMKIPLPSAEVMRILRRNFVDKPNIYIEFETAKADFYWCKDAFYESWTLVTVLEAIERIIFYLNNKEELKILPVDIMVIDEDCSLLDFVCFVKNNFMALQAKNLCQLQNRNYATSTHLNTLWEELPYKTILTKFINFLKTRNESTTSLLEMDNFLSTLTNDQCSSLVKEVSALQHSFLQSSSPDIYNESKLIELQTKLKKYQLKSTHFLREIVSINNIFERHEIPSSEVNSIISIICEQFEAGFEIELCDNKKKAIHHKVVDTISDKTIRNLTVFVISFVGNTFKNKLKSDLFTEVDLFPTMYLGEYCTCRLWKVPESLKPFPVDALLLVEMDDFGDIKSMIQQTSVALEICDLTTFFEAASPTRKESSVGCFDLSLLHCLSVGAFSLEVDVLVVTTDEKSVPSLMEHYNNLKNSLDKNPFQLGSRPEEPLNRFGARIENDTLVHAIPCGAVANTVQFSKPELEKFKTHLFDTVKATRNSSRTVSEFLRDFTKAWESFDYLTLDFKQYPHLPANYETKEEMLNDVLDFQTFFDRLKERLEQALMKHCTDGSDYLSKEMNKQEFNEVELSKAVKSHLETAGDSTCVPLNKDEPQVACNYCKDCIDGITEFKKRFPETPEEYITNIIKEYKSRIVELQYSRLHNLLASLSITFIKGLTPIFEIVYAEYKNLDCEVDELIKKVTKETIGRYWDANLLQGNLKIMEADLLISYSQSPIIYKQFMEDQSDTNFPGELLEYLERGLELRLMVQDVPGIILAADYNQPFGDGLPYKFQYEFGMMRKCRQQVQRILTEYSEKYLQKIRQDTIWAFHIYVLRILNKKVLELEKTELATSVLQQYIKNIEEEIKKRNKFCPSQEVSAQN